MTDPIADMLNRIINAQAVSKESVSFPFSKIKFEMVSLLQREGFVQNVEKKGRKEKRIIKIDLKNNAIAGVKRVSKPGQRIYVQSKEIKFVRGGQGLAIISTSKGLMTEKEARKNRLGGELICQIW
ncbi:MAG: 30S ribosomal protein S8 [Candidatus Nealsonbacteria bacterium RIFOXYB1_FULL_40_15]|uniref:Small ribosomal subunit protein uS8 n=2 Tax=Candidatus Nealsoniibacteriota TaxID=1817911 RepID=A0A1G2EN49_9BACT|nr:MAG: 30S ribosomal protein S8 [Candidatus Nealsonbacteria bacterium RIFOXYC1_FULL_40_7]OGZ27810.1 MAG: 30S ribosomal protein S8 [Candidatus Nealsonbacteria bacterium RIFOXYB1_FULL_40_15]OGZ28938.1 MAG: 30S ribosomal protein S8 [Candidatus Nealsonbacteria bacterium RIFOXYD1_FULL_39_11]